MGRSETMGLIARAAFLALAAGVVVVNARFAFTDEAWILMGSPAEAYPELGYLFVGLPLALAGLAGAASALQTRLTGREGLRIARAALWVGLGATTLSVLFAAAVFLPPGAQAPSGMDEILGSVLFLGSPLLMLVQFSLAVGAAVGSRPRQSGAPGRSGSL